MLRIAITLAVVFGVLLLSLMGTHIHAGELSDVSDSSLTIIPVTNCGYAPMLKSLIENATLSIYIAMNEISDYEPVKTLLYELVRAHERGVDVRIIYEGDISSNSYAANYLESYGIAVHNDSSGIYLHAKLVVIDNKTVYVGSHNWSPYAFEKNNEYGIIVYNQTLGRFFGEYFQSIWYDANSTPAMTNLHITDGGMSIQTTYDGFTYLALDSMIRSASTRLDVALYTMTYYSNPYGDEYLVDDLVNDIVDKSDIAEVVLDNHDSSYAYSYLSDNGVAVKYDSSSNITHLKLVIADDSVYIGDANWDYSYLDNDTHTVGVIITNETVANFFAEYFNSIYQYGDTPYYLPNAFVAAGDVYMHENSEKTVNVFVANAGQKTNTTVYMDSYSALDTGVAGAARWNRSSVYDWVSESLTIYSGDVAGEYVVMLVFHSQNYAVNYTIYLSVYVGTQVPEFNFTGAYLILAMTVIFLGKKYMHCKESACKAQHRGDDKE